VLLCFALLASPLASAAETPLQIKYAGFGFDTKIDGQVPDDQTVTLSQGRAEGSFGASEIAITAEFELVGVDDRCPTGYPLRFDLVYSATVLTFKDHSQLFGFSWNGWLCASATGGYVGEVYGVYAGGTGRFEDASGEFMSKYSGAYLDPSIGFRSIAGTAEGTVGRR
jgi:hypothetical protein